MIRFINRLAHRNKGLEALQAVLLVGVAFLICVGLRTIWNDSKTTVETEVKAIISSK